MDGGGGKGGGKGSGREGDWRCNACNNINFSFRRVCNRCGADKPPDAGMGGGGAVQGEQLQHLALRARHPAPHPNPDALRHKRSDRALAPSCPLRVCRVLHV